jgi:hypothetical protein
MTPLNPGLTTFGRHETFPLRFGWLTKGHQAWSENHAVFEQEDATVTLGVGKNMVSAIKYWMLATQIVKHDKTVLRPAELGDKLFDETGWDPYLEDDATIWLLHWLLASNAADATTLFWFFNRFHKPEFTSDELLFALQTFVAENLSSRASASTLKHDIALLTRMYQPATVSKYVPLEESLDSPFVLLGLLRPLPETKRHESKPEYRSQLPVAVLAYAVAELFAHFGQPNLPVERIMRSDGTIAAPGSVFRLTEECLIAKLEEMVAWLPGQLQLRESAGIHALYRLADIHPLEIVQRHYETLK